MSFASYQRGQICLLIHSSPRRKHLSSRGISFIKLKANEYTYGPSGHLKRGEEQCNTQCCVDNFIGQFNKQFSAEMFLTNKNFHKEFTRVLIELLNVIACEKACPIKVKPKANKNKVEHIHGTCSRGDRKSNFRSHMHYNTMQTNPVQLLLILATSIRSWCTVHSKVSTNVNVSTFFASGIKTTITYA